MRNQEGSDRSTSTSGRKSQLLTRPVRRSRRTASLAGLAQPLLRLRLMAMGERRGQLRATLKQAPFFVML